MAATDSASTSQAYVRTLPVSSRTPREAQSRTPDVDPTVHHYFIPHRVNQDGKFTCACRDIAALSDKHSVHREIAG